MALYSGADPGTCERVGAVPAVPFLSHSLVFPSSLPLEVGSLKPARGKGRQRQRHITLVERLKSHTATSEALVMSQAKLA